MRSDLAGVILAAVVARAGLLWGTQPALSWDSDTYLGIARYILIHGHPPPLTMRLPGYPIFILLSGGFEIDLTATVLFQHFLGIATTVVLFLVISILTEKRIVAAAGALAITTMPDILFMEVTVYSETLAAFLVAVVTWLFLDSVVGRTGPRRWAVLGAVTACAAWTRPNLVVLVPVIGAGILASEITRTGPTTPLDARVRTALRSAGVFVCLPAALIGGTMAANFFERGSFRLANGMGFSSLNVVGRPRIYRDLPSHLRWITQVYEQHEDQLRFGYIQWNVVLDSVLEARKRQGLSSGDYDRAALDTTVRVIRARPAAYLEIWGRTFLRYWRDYRVVFGPWRIQIAFEKPGPVQVTRSQWAIVLVLRGLWGRLQSLLAVSCLLALPFMLLDRGWDNRRRVVIATIWTAVVFSSIASTAIETAAGQDRYRMPYVAPIVVLASVTLVSLQRTVSQIVLRTRKGREHG